MEGFSNLGSQQSNLGIGLRIRCLLEPSNVEVCDLSLCLGNQELRDCFHLRLSLQFLIQLLQS